MPAGSLPIPRDAVGLSLRPEHYSHLEEISSQCDFVEIIAENHFGSDSLSREHARRFRERLPMVTHSVGLDLLGITPFDEQYIHNLRELCTDLRIEMCTAHLCWTRSETRYLHDLLPFPLRKELLHWAQHRIADFTDKLGVDFGIENVSTYMRFPDDEMTEWEFLEAVSDGHCGILLDINNVYVSSVNHGFDARTYLEGVPWSSVRYVHMAGHQTRADMLLHDTHDRPIAQEVWELYRYAWHIGGPFPSIIEWDADLPPMAELLDQLAIMKEIRS